MASIDKRADGRYRARWREYPGGPQKTRQFARKGDAQRFLDAIRGDLAHGVYVDPAGGRTQFGEFAEKWRVAQVHRPNTVTQLESYLRLHAYPTLGRRALGDMRRSEIQAWVKQLTAVLAPGSVVLVYRWVATIFKAAVGDRLIASSPCMRIALPKCNDAEVVPLSVAEVEALAAAVKDRYRALIIFGAGMGLRQGECFGLTVDRVTAGSILHLNCRRNHGFAETRPGTGTAALYALVFRRTANKYDQTTERGESGRTLPFRHNREDARPLGARFAAASLREGLGAKSETCRTLSVGPTSSQLPRPSSRNSQIACGPVDSRFPVSASRCQRPVTRPG